MSLIITYPSLWLRPPAVLASRLAACTSQLHHMVLCVLPCVLGGSINYLCSIATALW